MSEDHASKSRYGIWLPGSDELDIGHFSRLFDNKSESYKLFWFQAIIRKVNEGRTELSFDELINDMICDAWYMVTEYHLNLGPSDAIERVVKYINEKEKISPTEKKEKILAYLDNTDDKQVRFYKKKLIEKVPYRLQAPFLEGGEHFWNGGTHAVAERINQQPHLIYYFEDILTNW
ncbi:MAG: hypothetical protein SOI44_07955 [Lactimicrobium sp.]|jgi:hypothetical protein|uniref:hypothetical protein n=1 Tax=Lactimicrobium sp. TaxID=2563780 RepID=UPI002F35EEF4